MWACFNDGFLSAIQHRDDPDMLMVRARDKQHLINVFPDRAVEIFSVPKSDYAWRIVVSKRDYADIVANRIMEIDYDNFKNSVEDDPLHRMYEQFWWHGLMLQQGAFNTKPKYNGDQRGLDRLHNRSRRQP